MKTMECNTVVQNGVTEFDLHNSPGLSDSCAVKCYDVTSKDTTKPDAMLIRNYAERDAFGSDTNGSVTFTDSSSVTNLGSLVCDEVIIDGFSVLSFKSKKDLMLYSEQCEIDRRKLSISKKEEDLSKRIRRNGPGRQKRSKILHQQNSWQHTTDPNNMQELKNNDNKRKEDDAILSATRDSNRCPISYDLVPFSSSCDPPPSHTLRRDQEVQDEHFSKAEVTEKISPLRLSRIRKPDSTQTVVDVVNRSLCTGTTETDHDQVGGLSHPTTSDSHTRWTPQQHSVSDTTSHYSSSPSSTLSSVRNCHLTPLTISWNPPVECSPTNCEEQRADGSRSSCVDTSVLETHATASPQPSTDRPQSVGSSQAPTKPAHCHQFSVAALTEESTPSTSSNSPAPFRPSPTTVTVKSSSRRSTPHRSRPHARNLLHSPTPSTDDCSFSHSSLNCLPTAPRSGSTSPLPHPPKYDLYSSHHIHLHHQSVSDAASAPSPSSINRPRSDPNIPPNGIPPCDRSEIHLANNQHHEKSHSLCSTGTQFSSPIPLADRSSRTADSEAPKPPSSPLNTLQSHMPSLTCSPSPLTISMPDPRMLQQMMGIDINAANQLVKDSRFKELYSLTMANMAATERNLANVQAQSFAGTSPIRTSQPSGIQSDTGTSSNADSSPNPSVKTASHPSMNSLLRLKIMHDRGQVGPSNTEAVTNNSTLPSMKDSKLNRSLNVLHSAYCDRELIHRVPITSDSISTSSVPPQSSSMLMSNGDPALLKVLPPPPPLIAGYSSETDQLPPSVNDMSAAADRSRHYGSLIPPPPMLSSSNSFSVPRDAVLSNMSSSKSARPSPSVVSPQLPDLMGGAVQSYWESFFRHMFGRPPGPTNFTGQNSHSVDLGNGPGHLPLHAPGLSTLHPSTQLPPRTQQLPTSFPHNATSAASSSSLRPVFPPPLPPPYNLNSMFHAQSQMVRPTSGSMTNTLKQSPRASPSLLQRRVHPDKSCGRWADAHVRIARYIHLCQSVKPGPSTHSARDDRLHLPLGASFVTPHSVIRPIARSLSLSMGPRHPHGGLPPRTSITHYPFPSRSWDNLNCPRPTQPIAVPTTVAPSTQNLNGELEKSPFWNYIVNSLVANLPPDLIASGHSAPRTQAMDVFLNSVMQRLNNHGSQSNQNNSMNGVPVNMNSQSSYNQPFSNSTSRSGSGSQPLVTKSMQPNTDHIPHFETKHAVSTSMFLPSNPLQPSNPMRRGSCPGSTASMMSAMNHVDGRSGLSLKRARLEPNLGHFDPSYQQTPFTLLQRLSHPSTSLHQHRQDLTMQSTASLLNGYRFPLVPSSGGNTSIHSHQTLPGTNEPVGATPSSLDKSRLKIGTTAPHLAPIRPW